MILAEQFNFAQHLLALNECRPESIAYVDDRGLLTYGQLNASVRRFARALLKAGLRREQRILLLVHDRTEWPIAFLGMVYAGLIPVPVNTLLTVDDYAYMIEHSGAAAAVVSGELLATLMSARERASHSNLGPIIVVGAETDVSRSPDMLNFDVLAAGGNDDYAAADTHRDSVAFWLYSSGSTGRSKGVVHTHANLYWTAELYAKPVLGITESDRVFSAAKLFFAYGLGNSLTFPLTVGASAILMAERPTPGAVLTRLREHGATIFCAAPTLYASMLASTASVEKPPKLRLCTSAGEALPAEIGEKFSQRFGADIIDGLGSTEMLHIFVSNRPSDICYGTTGRPVEGYEVQLRDEDGQILGCDQIGDLWARGPSSALFYWNDRAKTQSTFHGQWLRTGDKYLRRADGCYVYAGRNDDMLKISGQFVSPFEVESTLMQHPCVLESGVVAVVDRSGIAKSKAYVVLKDTTLASDAIAEELKSFVKSKLAPFKRPQFVEFVQELPKTATGKIQRFRLRERSISAD